MTNWAKKKCKICGKEFRPVVWCEAFCSISCKIESKKISDKKYRLKNAEKLKIKKQIEYKTGKKVKCKQCGAEYTRANWAVGNFCSKQCYYDHEKKNRVGKKNPAWKNGNHPHTYNRAYKKYVENVLNTTLEQLGCERCGITSGTMFDRHHIIFKSEKPNHPMLNTVANIIQVCRSCHMLLHGDKKIRNDIVIKRNLEQVFNCKLLR